MFVVLVWFGWLMLVGWCLIDWPVGLLVCWPVWSVVLFNLLYRYGCVLVGGGVPMRVCH